MLILESLAFRTRSLAPELGPIKAIPVTPVLMPGFLTPMLESINEELETLTPVILVLELGSPMLGPGSTKAMLGSNKVEPET